MIGFRQVAGPYDQEQPPHPNPLPQGGEGEREQIGGLSKLEFGSIDQVGAARINTAVGPLYLWERARVRAAV